MFTSSSFTEYKENKETEQNQSTTLRYVSNSTDTSIKLLELKAKGFELYF